MIGLDEVITTLSFSVVLAAVAMFVILAWLLFRRVSGRKSSFDRAEYLSKIRFAVVLFPLLWLVMNFTEDSNYLAGYMFDTFVPFVLVAVLAISLFELVMPFLSLASRETGERGKMVLDKGGR